MKLNFLTRTSIRTKIISLIVPLGVVGLCASGLMAVRYQESSSSYSRFISEDNSIAVELARADRNLVASAYGAYQTLSYKRTDPSLKVAVDLYRDNTKTLMRRLTEIKQRMPSLAEDLDAFASRAEAIIVLTDQAVDYGSQEWTEDAKRTLASADAQIVELSRDIAKFLEQFNGEIVSRSKALDRQASSTIQTLLGSIALVFLLGLMSAFIISKRGITSPLNALAARMDALAEGNFEILIPGCDRGDELGKMAKAVQVFKDNGLKAKALEAEAEHARSTTEKERARAAAADAKRAAEMAQATAGLAEGLKQLAGGNLGFELSRPFASDFEGLRTDFNAAVSQLRDTLSAVADATRSIDGGSRELSSSANDLSRRTEQQAASLEETAAALDQITANVSNASKRTEEARAMAMDANRSAGKSEAVVSDAVNAMQRIETSSSQISNIIGVIDEIAFQTNLLALNAGVEAARAGEAGKGFAVVAQEVRELAQRSAQAAKEIKDLIRTSADEVENGVKLVSATGDALKMIGGYVVSIHSQLDAIATSAREQSVGLSEVNTAVNQMDQTTQQNAAMVEQATAASTSLAGEADKLRQLVGRFQLGGGAVSISAFAYAKTGYGEAHAPKPARFSIGDPVAASSRHVAAPSPARTLVGKLARAVGVAASASTATASGSWEEF